MRKLFFSMLLMLPLTLLAQKKITGYVSDENGAPLVSANVQEKGKLNTVVTDAGGNFSIKVQDDNAVLVISSVNFTTQEVNVGEKTSVNVKMVRSGNLNEVVVTAFGIKKQKRSLGYSTQEVGAKDLEVAKQPNIINALQGKVAGVQINSTGGAPGQGASILIRGVKSLDPNKNNQPLFVIDGVIMDNSTSTVGAQASLRGMSNRAADLNPNDIENVSILKGGAATALYGQAGSNGVVVITTKSGRAGKIQVGVDATYGID